MRVIRVSGTIRKAEEEAIRRARVDIIRARSEGRAGLVEEKDADDLLEDLIGGMGDGDAGEVRDEDAMHSDEG